MGAQEFKKISLSAASKALLIFVLAVAFANCSKVNFSGTGKNTVGPYVCDPFGGGGGSGGGLKGKLFYFENMPANGYSTVLNDYFTLGTQNNTDIFMTSLNIPTKPWSAGFQSSDGTALKKLDGTTLFEWFALKLKSQIQLAPTEPEGAYQFGMLSDDGSILRTDDGSNQVLVNNDGVTMTRFSYASQPVQFTRSTKFPVQVEYFQGPRYHIALIMMWRVWNGNAVDPAGGQAGNDLYFNSATTPPTAQQAYNDLLTRGWRPLVPENFVLPGNEVNPCH